MIEGIVKDKSNKVIEEAIVYLEDSNYEIIYETKTDKFGKFEISKAFDYKYIIIVKSYKDKYLEYWCNNICKKDCNLNVVIDRLEVYDLTILYAGSAVLLRFRPMSLDKYINKEDNICPNIIKIDVLVDGIEAKVIRESVCEDEKTNMNLYLIQIGGIDSRKLLSLERVDIKITDSDGNVGMATIIK